jgi:hypothetical protein
MPIELKWADTNASAMVASVMEVAVMAPMPMMVMVAIVMPVVMWRVIAQVVWAVILVIMPMAVAIPATVVGLRRGRRGDN